MDNVRLWHGADVLTKLKVRWEREAGISLKENLNLM